MSSVRFGLSYLRRISGESLPPRVPHHARFSNKFPASDAKVARRASIDMTSLRARAHVYDTRKYIRASHIHELSIAVIFSHDLPEASRLLRDVCARFVTVGPCGGGGGVTRRD